VVLTFRQSVLDEIMKSGDIGGEEIRSFLVKLKTISKEVKYFWKYEEGSMYGRPHFHVLIDFKKKLTKSFLAAKIFKRKWEEGVGDLTKVIKDSRKRSKRFGFGEKSDVAVLLGKLLYKKWNKKGGVYVKEIKGLGKKDKFNIIYYVNKDLMKPSTYNKKKKGKAKWSFGKGYKFDFVSVYDKSMILSKKKAIALLMRTKMNFIRRYDSIGVNGFSRSYSKIRKIQNGDYDKVIT